MPLPSDEKLLALSEDLLKQFDTIFGLHPGFRPAHAKGIMLGGTFTPAPEAKTLTKAPHILREETPVSVRFSNSTGIPLIPDNDANADPRGIAIRFQLAEHVHTDIIAHATDGFPTRTGQEFLEFLRDPPAFIGSHPAALAFVQAPKPAPTSFAKDMYYGVTAMQFTNSEGVTKFGRYRIVPDAGVEHLDAETLKTKGPDFLFDELTERIAGGPVSFEIMIQIAADGDITDDATVHWPEDRKLMPLGKVVLTTLIDADEQKKIIFDPIPRIDGIDPSADPLLELRAAIYLMSGRRRRQSSKASTA
jgi:catalase